MINVKFDTFTEACKAFNYGKNFLNLPEEARDTLNELFSDVEIVPGGTYDIDGLYINSYQCLETEEVLVDWLDLFTYKELNNMTDKEIEDYVAENYDEILDDLNDTVLVLSYEKYTRFKSDGMHSASRWHVLN